jgi:hypothetical protein
VKPKNPALSAAFEKFEAVNKRLRPIQNLLERIRPMREAQQEADRIIELLEDPLNSGLLDLPNITPLALLLVLEKKGDESTNKKAKTALNIKRSDEWRKMILVVVGQYQNKYGTYPEWELFWSFLCANPPVEFGVIIKKGKRGVRETAIEMSEFESITKANLKKRFDRLPKIDR